MQIGRVRLAWYIRCALAVSFFIVQQLQKISASAGWLYFADQKGGWGGAKVDALFSTEKLASFIQTSNCNVVVLKNPVPVESHPRLETCYFVARYNNIMTFNPQVHFYQGENTTSVEPAIKCIADQNRQWCDVNHVNEGVEKAIPLILLSTGCGAASVCLLAGLALTYRRLREQNVSHLTMFRNATMVVGAVGSAAVMATVIAKNM